MTDPNATDETKQHFARFDSDRSVDLLNWAYVLRNSLTSAAEAIEGDGTDDNQLEVLIDLIKELIVLGLSLPMPDTPMDPIDLAPLQRLLEALVRVQTGHSDTLLKPRRAQIPLNDGRVEPKRGRKTSSLHDQRIRAHGVAFVVLLEEVGVHGTEARNLVAACFTNAGICGQRGGGITEATVRTWINESRATGKRPGEGALAQEFADLMRRMYVGKPKKDVVLEDLYGQAQLLAKRL